MCGSLLFRVLSVCGFFYRSRGTASSSLDFSTGHGVTVRHFVWNNFFFFASHQKTFS